MVDISNSANDLLSGLSGLNITSGSISFNTVGTLSGASYTLATYASGSESGTFTTDLTLPGGYQLDYTSTALLLDQTTVVPEPSTWLAGLLVFASLLVTQRRRFSRLVQRTASA